MINSTNNNWTGFPFLFGICTAASIVIWFVDVEAGRENCRKYVEERKLVQAAKSANSGADEDVVEGESDIPTSTNARMQ
jgi:hypothetical protein